MNSSEPFCSGSTTGKASFSRAKGDLTEEARKIRNGLDSTKAAAWFGARWRWSKGRSWLRSWESGAR